VRRWLCLHCSKVAVPEGPLFACPYCGSTGVPADLDDKLTVEITRHELRVVMIWAEQWAASMNDPKTREDSRKVVAGIAARLKAQDPKAGALTMSDELAALADAYPGMETNFPIHRDDADPRELPP
jgi:hypothetical protein